MLLSKILSSYFNSKKNSYLESRLLLRKLFFKIVFLKKKEGNLIDPSKIFKKKSTNVTVEKEYTNKLINYILIINTSLTNTIVTLSDTKGKLLKSFSSGHIPLLKGKQKTKQPDVLIMLLKMLINKTSDIQNKPIAIHFVNVKEYNETLAVNMLREKFFIQFMKSYNVSPHNGCRPKKLKRLKRKKK
jgi:ribosomal protein S11